VKLVSERLGDASIQLAQEPFSHVLPAMQTPAAVKMDGIIGGKRIAHE
jgi:hypothetical protein